MSTAIASEPVIVPVVATAPGATTSPTVTYPSLKSYAPSDVAGMIRGMEEDGYIVIRGLMSRAEVAEMHQRIDALTPFSFDRKTDDQAGIDHLKCVFNRNPYWLQFIDRPGAIDVVEGVLGNDAHIIGQTAWRSWPGAGGWGMHIDQQFFPVDEALLQSGAVKLPMFLATGHYYLNDMTLELCPTWIVPGSHTSGRGPGAKSGDDRAGFISGQEDEWNGVKAVPVLLQAGDFMLFRSEVWHTGSKNTTTDQTRYLLQVHYGRRVMAQRFSPYLDFRFNHEVLAAATPRQKRMLGGHQPGAYD